jgi:D-xylose 1-dehydrogenase (NADP+, D-xylono-1,5-lactone-forming)
MQSNETPRHAPVRWGVLSAANIAVKRMIPAIVASSNGRLLAVGSRNPERAREFLAPEVIIYSDYESVINDPEIEAIYNPLPNSLHTELTCR